jgi:hypothetical protein
MMNVTLTTEVSVSKIIMACSICLAGLRPFRADGASGEVSTAQVSLRPARSQSRAHARP